MSKSFKITDVNIFDGEKFTRGDVHISNGTISSSASSPTDTIDGSNKYLIPGLIDHHIHLRAPNVLPKLASHGVTTALDMGDWPPSHYQALQNQQGQPTIHSAGPPATCPGSMHSKFPGLTEYLISSPSNAEDWVAQRVAEGSSYIKLISDVPGPSQDLLNALVAASHKHGKKVVIHAARKVPFEMAIEAEPDFITHLPIDEPPDHATMEKMKTYGIASVPTLTIEEAMVKWRGPPLNYEAAKMSFGLLLGAGVPVLAGTDANGTDFCPVEHGASIHHELKLMVEAGMTTVDALRAATEMVKWFGLGDRGKIEEGMRADLVLLGKNPLVDIENTRSVERVWIAGEEYKL